MYRNVLRMPGRYHWPAGAAELSLYLSSSDVHVGEDQPPSGLEAGSTSPRALAASSSCELRPCGPDSRMRSYPHVSLTLVFRTSLDARARAVRAGASPTGRRAAGATALCGHLHR